MPVFTSLKNSKRFRINFVKWPIGVADSTPSISKNNHAMETHSDNNLTAHVAESSISPSASGYTVLRVFVRESER